MTKFVFWMMGIKQYPSSRAFWWRNVIVGALTLFIASSVIYDAFTKSLTGHELLLEATVIPLVGAIFMLYSPFFLAMYYGPILEIWSLMKIVYHGFVPFCKAAWDMVRGTPAAARSVTARDVNNVLLFVFTLTVLGTVMTFLWPVAAGGIADLPSWVIRDAFESWMFTLMLDVIMSAFGLLFVVSVLAVIVKRHRMPKD